MYKIIYTALMCSSLILVSCHKKDHNHNMEAVENVVSISFSTSAIEDTIASGDEFHITGSIDGTAEMHGFDLTLKNLENDSILHKYSNYKHNSSYPIHTHWMNNLSSTTNMEIKVVVVKDHEGNTETKTMKIVGKGV